ncbi:hypothetical protein [Lamprocystis purpurea]|jgi:hypothetical protein|uniref:hypothetical protein n=1 Tax=Lamprocystis purpurea TaxID=61598 RepID=UPI0003671DE0|nr:hypothetical protein [Lamprocystis purpurea]
MTDTVTPWVGLPLPHQDNTLEYDLPRLRAALTSIDGLLHLLDQLTVSDDPLLGTMQGLVNAARAVRADLLQLVPASSTALAYNLDGTISTLSETLPDAVVRVTTYTYDPTTGDVLTVTVAVAGTTYRTTYTYSDGALVSMLREVVP